jgi:hypothetical protein
MKISSIYNDSFLNYNKIKFDFVKNWLCVKIPVLTTFLGFFLTLLKTTGHFLLLTPKVPTKFIFFFKETREAEIKAIFYTLKRDDRYTY